MRRGEGVRRRKADLVLSDLEKNHFFVNAEIFGIQIRRKKGVNYDKVEVATKQRKSNI